MIPGNLRIRDYKLLDIERGHAIFPPSLASETPLTGKIGNTRCHPTELDRCGRELNYFKVTRWADHSPTWLFCCCIRLLQRLILVNINGLLKLRNRCFNLFSG
jgi:hypothetical protein